LRYHSPTLRVIRIVDYISAFTDKGVPLSDIVKELDIPKTTVFNIVNTLVSEGVIEETGETIKRYRLGFQSFVIAKRYVEKMTSIDIANPVLKELSDITNLTSFIAKQDKSSIFYIYKYRPEKAQKTQANIGMSNPVNTTALGKAYLLTLTNSELQTALEELEFASGTEHAITNKDDMYKHITEYRRKGYTVDIEESQEGLCCYAAPVFNENGEYEASISISGFQATQETQSLYGKLIKQAANKISAQLGYRKGE
jgi:DNA-binding IclR family transcriptional regulator